jgi:hypothetical protein
MQPHSADSKTVSNTNAISKADIAAKPYVLKINSIMISMQCRSCEKNTRETLKKSQLDRDLQSELYKSLFESVDSARNEILAAPQSASDTDEEE